VFPLVLFGTLFVAPAPTLALGDSEVLAPGARPVLLQEQGAGEGPAWHPELGILTSGNGHINRLSLDGKSTVHRKDAGTNGLLFDAKGNLLACEAELRAHTNISPTTAWTVS